MKKGVKYRHFLKYMLLKRLLLKGLCLFYDSLSQLHVAELQINFFCTHDVLSRLLDSHRYLSLLHFWSELHFLVENLHFYWHDTTFAFIFLNFFSSVFEQIIYKKKNQRETETKKPCKYLFFSSCFKNTPNKELRMYQASYKASIELKA